MTITQADIQKLASLSRMKLTEDEQSQFASEIDSILGYVEQIKEVSSGGNTSATAASLSHANKKPSDIPHRNLMREDIADTQLNPDTSKLVEAAPAYEQGFVKVKKILN
jgi:aspartyl-tRNA(Asn)/glutamyl-tRNA(Gln) amidotransferase subunit C